MKIIELLSEQMVGTTGTTPTGTSSQPNKPPTQPTQQQQSDPDKQKLAATLKNVGVVQNDIDVDNFMSAYQAQSTGKTLNTDQQEMLAKLAPALLKDRTLSQKIDLQLKTMSQQKPQQVPGQ
jgi:glutamine synthetase adenylyltransferase